MSQASDYLENKLLDHLFNKSQFTSPTMWVALCEAAPSDTSTGTTISETDYTGYARINQTAANWNTASSGTTDNSAAITFAEATGAGTNPVTHFALVDASSAGNLLCYGTLTSSLTVSVGVTPKFAIGDCNISVD